MIALPPLSSPFIEKMHWTNCDCNDMDNGSNVKPDGRLRAHDAVTIEAFLRDSSFSRVLYSIPYTLVTVRFVQVLPGKCLLATGEQL